MMQQAAGLLIEKFGLKSHPEGDIIKKPIDPLK